MAKAGWIYNGNGPDSDIATCFYCGKSLDGWEMGDDPTCVSRSYDSPDADGYINRKEHKSRVPTCPVFTAKLVEPPSPPTPVVDLDPEPGPAPTSGSIHTERPPASATSTTASKRNTKGTTKSRTKAKQVVEYEVTEESDVPSQAPKRGRTKKTNRVKQEEPGPTLPVETEHIPPPTRQTKSRKPARATSVSRTVDPMEEEEEENPKSKKRTRATSLSREPEHKEEEDPKPKKARGKGKKTAREASREPSASVAEEDEDVAMKAVSPPTSATKEKKKATTKKGKGKKRVVSVTNQDTDKESILEEVPTKEEEVEPVKRKANKKIKDSLGGWESMEAANRELEEMAKELDIEGEFRAIDQPTSKKSTSKPTGSKASSKVTAPPKLTTSKSTKPTDSKLGEDSKWTYRLQGVDNRSGVTGTETDPGGTDFTEEEEIEQSLVNSDEDIPPSRATSIAPPSKSSTASATDSSRTKKLKSTKMSKVASAVKEAQALNLGNEMEGVEETPKPLRILPAKPPSRQPTLSQPPPIPSQALTSQLSGPSLSVLSSQASHPQQVPAPSFPQPLVKQLEAPLIPTDASSYTLTEEEREMTLEEWIRFEIERRKGEVREEGARWIEGFLESAERVRERIRAL